MVEPESPSSSCGTCRFERQGRCCRYPPQMIFAVQPLESYPASVFPAVDADAWCGEYALGSKPRAGGNPRG